MIGIHPRTIIIVGFLLVLFGFIAPFLMVIRIIEASFVLSFLSYAASVAGLLLGLIGAAWYSHAGRR
jgi:hypothetical protein